MLPELGVWTQFKTQPTLIQKEKYPLLIHFMSARGSKSMLLSLLTGLFKEHSHDDIYNRALLAPG